jgi:thiamine-monophosphate kinase
MDAYFQPMHEAHGSNGGKRTEISTLGEFGLIRHLTEKFPILNKQTIKTVGDDAAVIRPTEGAVTVATTDMLVEGIHFDLMYVPLKHLGYKSVVVNLSDIFAMNAWPTHILVSIAVSNRFSVEALDELYEGIRAACDYYAVDLVGGDTNSSNSGLVISVTALGEAEESKVVYRSGAKANDMICVSGDLGSAYLGLQLLEREKQLFLENPKIQPDLEGEKYIVGRFLKPEARKDVIEMFDELKLKPTAMIDVSDGLASDMMHICHESAVGCRLYEEKIPISEEAIKRAMTFNLDAFTCALNGGEDYELLFTIDPADLKKFENNPHFTVIGHITKPAEGQKLVTKSGQTFDLKAQGWVHF